ncbi:hypothetical protein [Candidatus Leptofilum sp.]|uniref:hypothetical protein n=1 Tax=Candidatus Leptofilum sp. TaxID=3241576 RepID=UPI003B58E3EA
MTEDKDKEFSRGQKVTDAQKLKARVEAELTAMVEQAATELAEAPDPSAWEVFAVGPYQDPGLEPGRIIELNDTAYIATVVWLNPFMDTNLSGLAGQIQLSYFTANKQTMEPVPDMNYHCCFEPGSPALVWPGVGSFYVHVWEFVPSEAACILETNICARVCNCDGEAVPGYAAFVRWVPMLDFDAFFPSEPAFTFDHPIRYLVYNNEDDTNCECTEACEEGELPPIP